MEILISIMKLLVTGGLGFIGSNFISRIFENHENWSIVKRRCRIIWFKSSKLEKI